jgi:putative ABC transport system permease protein
MTRAYAEDASLLPNDLALMQIEELLDSLRSQYPDMSWSPRIQFGGLIDVPDSAGETRSQGTAIGWGLELIANQDELNRLDLQKALRSGHLPRKSGDALLSHTFAGKLGIAPGDEFTLISSTMNGGMAMYNFRLSGTVHFGVEIMDRGSIIADLKDVQLALEMENAAGEITGFSNTGFYDNNQAEKLSDSFNSKFKTDDEFSPVMLSLSQQGNMGQYVQMSEVWSAYVSLIFIFAMSLVLWNAGLLGGLRRYGEVGIRLAMGESKGHVYRSMIAESVFIGIAGSVTGTAIGLGFAWLLQTYGLDISGMMQGASLMMPTIIKARITPTDFYIGFFPGVISTVIGTLLSGIGIYRRQTAKLFKELEA